MLPNLPAAAGGRFGAGVMRATACVRGGRISSLQPQVLEHLQRLLSTDIRGSDPATDSFGLQMAQRAVADIAEDRVGAVLAGDQFNNALTARRFGFQKVKGMALRVRHHDPFCLAEM